MSLSRRGALALIAGLAGCSSALTNDRVELAIENRSSGAQETTVTVTVLDGAEPSPTPGEPVFEGTVPPGSRQLVSDVAPAPQGGGVVPVRLTVETGIYSYEERIVLTGRGTIDVRITRNGVRAFFTASG